MSRNISVATKVDELSIQFDDYTPEARERYEGTHFFVGLHLPIEYAKHFTLSTQVTVVAEVTA